MFEFLSIELQEEIDPTEEEDQVRSPGRQERGQECDVAQGLEEPGQHPVEEAKGDPQSQSSDGSPGSERGAERKSQQGNECGNEREGELLVPLHEQACDSEAALA